MTTREELQSLIAADWQAYRAAVEQEPGRWWLRRRELPDGRVLFLQKLPHFYRVTVGPSQWPLFRLQLRFRSRRACLARDARVGWER